VAIVLAFLSSVGFGVADFIGGLQSRRLSVPVVLVVAQLAGLATIALILAILPVPLPPLDSIALGLLSGAVLIFGMAAYYWGLSTGAMGVVAPIVATSVLVPLAAGLLTGDRPTPVQVLGILLAIAGVIAIAYQPAAPSGGRRIALGVGVAILAALAIGTYYVLIARAAEDASSVWAALFHRVGSVTLLALVVYPYLTRGPLRSTEGAWPRVRPLNMVAMIAVGAIGITSTLVFTHATTLGLLSLVSVIAALFPVTTVLLARLILGERISTTQRAGAIAALAGVALIAS
jgi:drug/metabolite transporter (DMT)-like permease